MKKLFYSLALVTAVMTTSCSDNDTTSPEIINDSDKEMISFSMSDGTPTSRVGFREANTRIIMRIQSDDRHSSSDGSRYTRALALANKDVFEIEDPEATDYVTPDFAYSTISTNSDPRYWDDAYGRYGQLSVYAIAIPNKNDEELLPLSMMYDGTGSLSTATNSTWGKSASATDNIDNNKVSFTVATAAQTITSIGNQDLVYSNNIQEYDASTKKGMYGVYRYSFTDPVGYPANTGVASAHGNGRLIFAQNGVAATAQPTDAPGKFDKGHLIFKHALSRITVELKEGTGFNTSADTDFKFTKAQGASEVTNIKLLNMYTSGTFDVKTGIWNPGTATSITKMAPQGTYSTAAGIYMAQMLPGYTFVKDDNTNVMEFTIDNNTYYITKGMLFKALNDNAGTGVGKNGLDASATTYTMGQGQNFSFKINVEKAAINAITATLAAWVDVTAEENKIDNSHISITTKKLDGTNGKPCRDFNLFRFEEPLGEIVTGATLPDGKGTAFSGDYKSNGIANKTETTPGSSNIWNTDWYYKDNMTAYHLRTLNNIATDGTNTNSSDNTENIENTGSPAISSFKMVSGSQSTQDYHWGAPLKTDANLKYDITTNKGFVANIHPGFVAPANKETNTDNKTVNITEFHMMSNINIKLVTDSVAYDDNGTTKYKAGPAAVTLNNATVTLTRFAKTGTVDMGTGYITAIYNSSDNSADMVLPAFSADWNAGSKTYTGNYTYAVVPQALRRSTAENPAEADCVGITIKTTDNNEYYVIKNLADIIASAVTDQRNQEVNKKIERWYPGHNYYYIIKITKKGIESITCTLADWVTVTGTQQDITLEN